MLELLAKWSLVNKRPSINDVENLTIIEQTAKIYGKMNELVEDYNSFVEGANKTITDFINDTTKNNNEFEVAIRQEFQDFIDVIEIKFAEQQSTIDEAISFMQDNIIATTRNIVNDSIAKGNIVINTLYDGDTESVTLIADGRV